MTNTTSNRLKKSIHEIMNVWEERALEEIRAAHYQETLALRDSLPEYLMQLAMALSTTVDRTVARKRFDKEESTRVGKKHGKERAGSMNYTMDQMILEYHILRQVICDVLENEVALTSIEREVIVCSIEQAVNDAATQFSDTLKDFQEHLAHSLAHDLRNPLTIAKVSAQLILRQLENKENCEDKTHRILKSVNRIDKMISELLDASRVKAGEIIALDFKDCDLDLLLKEISIESNLAHENAFVVKSDGACIGSWNEDGLRRIIENLSTNAVKYGSEKKPITISLIQDEISATLSIHNHGEPIAHEEQTILFQKFRRSRTSENKVGWGLGLTIVKGMVEAHGGSITVESEHGKGTTFIINLPKEQAAVTVAARSVNSFQGPVGWSHRPM